jgi:hypothetical protein
MNASAYLSGRARRPTCADRLIKRLPTLERIRGNSPRSCKLRQLHFFSTTSPVEPPATIHEVSYPRRCKSHREACGLPSVKASNGMGASLQTYERTSTAQSPPGWAIGTATRIVTIHSEPSGATPNQVRSAAGERSFMCTPRCVTATRAACPQAPARGSS